MELLVIVSEGANHQISIFRSVGRIIMAQLAFVKDKSSINQDRWVADEAEIPRKHAHETQQQPAGRDFSALKQDGWEAGAIAAAWAVSWIYDRVKIVVTLLWKKPDAITSEDRFAFSACQDDYPLRRGVATKLKHEGLHPWRPGLPEPLPGDFSGKPDTESPFA